MLAAVLTVSVGMVSLAAGENHTITIQNNAPGHTYEAYQIFTGDLSADGKTFSNIQWGNGINGENLLNALKTADAGTYGSCKSASDVAKALNSGNAKEFAKIASEYLTETKTTGTYNTTQYTIAGLDDGYYLIKDATAVSGSDANTEYILKITDDETVTPKSDIPESYKKVKDTNDSTGLITDWQDSADYDIGDSIPFQLTATLPDNYSAYETYTMTFHDTEEQGLEFQKNTVKVYVDEGTEPIDVSYYNIVENPADGCTFEITFSNVKNITNVTDSSKIRVEYESVLTEDAIIGSAGNPNEMYLSYSNNPYGTGTGTTPVDTVIVFTYQTIVNKVDEEMNPLAGAEFKLEKKIYKEGGSIWQEITRVALSQENTVFTFTGLDDGDYRLTETKTPDRYNTMEPVEFTVAAEHTSDSNQDGICDLTALTGNVTSGEITFAENITQGSLTTNVINESGTILPGTGGMGTTIFYIAGIILVAGAAVLITVKVKKNRR